MYSRKPALSLSLSLCLSDAVLLFGKKNERAHDDFFCERERESSFLLFDALDFREILCSIARVGSRDRERKIRRTGRSIV